MDMDATVPDALSLSVHLKDRHQSHSTVYLNYMAVEYNVSFPQAAREQPLLFTTLKVYTGSAGVVVGTQESGLDLNLNY